MYKSAKTGGAERVKERIKNSWAGFGYKRRPEIIFELPRLPYMNSRISFRTVGEININAYLHSHLPNERILLSRVLELNNIGSLNSSGCKYVRVKKLAIIDYISSLKINVCTVLGN